MTTLKPDYIRSIQNYADTVKHTNQSDLIAGVIGGLAVVASAAFFANALSNPSPEQIAVKPVYTFSTHGTFSKPAEPILAKL